MFRFDNSFARTMEGFYLPAEAAKPPAPRLVYFNEKLAGALGIDRAGLSVEDIAALLSGGAPVPDSAPIALAYAGHQFGTFNPQLGDGRALLLGEHIGPDGSRHDVQLKGSGPTPFSRGGDGKAALGPVLREYLMSAAMAALGVPTTRALAAVATGDKVLRDRVLPGAVLTRIAASHLRIGTIQFFAAHGGAEAVRQIADHAIARHCPSAAEAANPYLALLDHVIGVQCGLVAQWMALGFVHGVMNTDNMTLSGETIDYGPCAFVDAYSAAAVFSSIDHIGRYAFGRQPHILHWNLARLAEALLPAIAAVRAEDHAAAMALIEGVPGRYYPAMLGRMRAKLGLVSEQEGDQPLVEALFAALQGQGVDFTLFFRSLTDEIAGKHLSDLPPPVADWAEEWRARVAADEGPTNARLAMMRAANPAVIPRNHLVEAALNDAVDRQDFGRFDALMTEVSDPYRARDADDPFTRPPAADAPPHVTFCGT
ncbi:MAG: YdiU family protein [Sphingopyxis sp.]|nr:YdiU family protein [Sphingopyxis sp.]